MRKLHWLALFLFMLFSVEVFSQENRPISDFGALESSYLENLAALEKSLGPDHPVVAMSLNNLANVYWDQAKYAQAEPLFQRALSINETALGPDHPDVAMSLIGLANVYEQQAKYAQAEPLFQRALSINETALGPDHPDVEWSLNNLANVYEQQAKYAQAEPLYQRALSINKTALGPDHPVVAWSLNNLANVYEQQAKYAQAEPLFQRALSINETALGPDHPDVAIILNNLASFYWNQAKYAQAEPLYQRALSINETALGPDHPVVAMTLNNLANVYGNQAKYAQAEPLYQRALSIIETALGPDHPNVAIILRSLASFYAKSPDLVSALHYIRRASKITSSRSMLLSNAIVSGPSNQKILSDGNNYLMHLDILSEAIQAGVAGKDASFDEAFQISQLASMSQTSLAMAQLGPRFAAEDDDLATLVRKQQDAVQEWRVLNVRLVEFLGKPQGEQSKAEITRLRNLLASIENELQGLDTELSLAFPEYRELANPSPVPLREVQASLGKSEALLTYSVSDQYTYLIVVRNDAAELHRIEVGKAELDAEVKRLRSQLDPSRVVSLQNIPEFDAQAANDLYDKIFAPAEPLLEGVDNILLVPDAGLQSLPFNVLVTEPPQGKSGAARDIDWLAKSFAISVLPSVSSLAILRNYAKKSDASSSFAGFGDPLLGDHPENTQNIELAGVFKRGAVADVEYLRDLQSLPETADELRTLAAALNATEEDLFLRDRATETIVRSNDLDDYRVLAFATHALVAGELKGLEEPGLVLTPPIEGTPQDDGFLTASEIATMHLDADLVILSACNTAASDGTPGAEGLSGLAKAFMYAGSRGLMVSHWPVESFASARLTTGMLDQLSQEPEKGASEALRRSMLQLMDDPIYYRPMFWAPFIIVGDG